jgi:hypothetical protein
MKSGVPQITQHSPTEEHIAELLAADGGKDGYVRIASPNAGQLDGTYHRFTWR